MGTITRGAFIAILFLFASYGSLQAQSAVDLHPKEFYAKIITLDNEVILDVRMPSEFKAGHIENAVNIDWTSKTWKSSIENLDKQKPYLLYCAGGGRSSDAAEALREAGFTKVYNLKDGIDAWESAGLPVIQ